MLVKSTNQEKTRAALTPTDVPLEALPVVEISADELRRATEIAQHRNTSYQRIDGGTLFNNTDSLRNHEIGVLGELAVAKLYNVSIDTGIYGSGDDGYDVSFLGQDVDVKTTATDKMRLPELLVRADKDLAADLYVRAHVIDFSATHARIRLIGYATRGTVAEREPSCHPGDTANYVLPPSELTILPHVQRCHDCE